MSCGFQDSKSEHFYFGNTVYMTVLVLLNMTIDETDVTTAHLFSGNIGTDVYFAKPELLVGTK